MDHQEIVESLLPQRLKELRMEYGWTLEDVAQRLGFAQRGVASNWEATNQRRRTPDLATLLQLQRWYGVSLDYLVGQPNAERDSPAVRAGKQAVREHLLRLDGVKAMAPRERAQAAVTTAMEVAPVAFFQERVAAYLAMSPAEFLEIYENGFWTNRLIDRIAQLFGLNRDWFFSQEPAKVLGQTK